MASALFRKLSLLGSMFDGMTDMVPLISPPPNRREDEEDYGTSPRVDPAVRTATEQAGNRALALGSTAPLQLRLSASCA